MTNLNLTSQNRIKGIKEICNYLQDFDYDNLKPFVLYSNVYFLIELAHEEKLNFAMGTPLFDIQHTLNKELEFSLSGTIVADNHQLKMIKYHCQKLLSTL